MNTDSATGISRDELRRKLEFYQDLGFTHIYRRAAAVAAAAPVTVAPVMEEIVIPSLAPAGDTLLIPINPEPWQMRLVKHADKVER